MHTYVWKRLPTPMNLMDPVALHQPIATQIVSSSLVYLFDARNFHGRRNGNASLKWPVRILGNLRWFQQQVLFWGFGSLFSDKRTCNI